MLDRSGLLIPQARIGLPAPQVRGEGHITYRCHTCGELITRPYEVLFVADGWCSTIVPPMTGPSTTTHHAWHCQEDEI